MVFSIGGLIIFYGIEGNPVGIRFGMTFSKMFTGFMCFTILRARSACARRLQGGIQDA